MGGPSHGIGTINATETKSKIDEQENRAENAKLKRAYDPAGSRESTGDDLPARCREGSIDLPNRCELCRLTEQEIRSLSATISLRRQSQREAIYATSSQHFQS